MRSQASGILVGLKDDQEDIGENNQSHKCFEGLRLDMHWQKDTRKRCYLGKVD